MRELVYKFLRALIIYYSVDCVMNSINVKLGWYSSVRKRIKTVLVTGATGFLGSHVTKKLLDLDFNVIILKRSFSDTWRIERVLDRAISYDIDKIEISTPFKKHKIDIIVHTATNYGRKGENVSDIVETNLVFPLQLLEIGVLYKIKSFFNFDTTLNKDSNYYSLSKKQFQNWLIIFANRIRIMNLKLEYIYGEKDDSSKLLPFVIKELLLGAKELNLTRGEQKRDFIYVQDVVDVFIRLINKIDTFCTGFYEYEIGSGKSIPIKELVCRINSQILNANTILNFGALPYRENEIMDSSADITKIKNDIGWCPQTSLEEGLKRTIDWYKERIDSGAPIQ